MDGQAIRWKQRFENLDKAYALLGEIDKVNFEGKFEPTLREAFVKRFEIAFELAWKTMKDYLEYAGVVFRAVPRDTIKEAFVAQVIEDGQVFVDMLEARNCTVHMYDQAQTDKILRDIQKRYCPALAKLCKFLRSQK
ncbi:MAG: nucleotidyltransferase substrate binding protein [Firmicutes bacterium]|nr:nucleotidyltransferase substrate binding protein [Bacillota bacterium]